TSLAAEALMKEAPVTLNPKSILIIKPSSLGDIVHTIPAVALVRDAYPNAEITWVINSEFVSLLRGNSDVNHVYIFPRGEFRGLGATKSLMPWLKQTLTLRPDLALDFQGLLRSALIAKISRAAQFYGMSDAREGSRWLYDRVAKVDRRAHAVERYIKLAELAGAAVGESLRCPIPTGDPLPRFDPYPDRSAPGRSLQPECVGLEKRSTLPRQQTRHHQNSSAGAPVQVQGRSRPGRNDPATRPTGLNVRLAHASSSICRRAARIAL